MVASLAFAASNSLETPLAQIDSLTAEARRFIRSLQGHDPSRERRYRPQTTMPYPTPREALEFRWALACLLSTLLVILHEVSRVHTVRLNRDDLGGVFWAPLPRFAAS